MGSRRPARESPATTDSEAGRSDPRHWADRACVRGRSCLHAAGYAQQSQRRDQPDHRHRPVSGYTLTRVFELFSTPTRFYVVAAVERSAGATFCVVPREELGLPGPPAPGRWAAASAQSCRPVQFGSIFVRGCAGPVRRPAPDARAAAGCRAVRLRRPRMAEEGVPENAEVV